MLNLELIVGDVCESKWEESRGKIESMTHNSAIVLWDDGLQSEVWLDDIRVPLRDYYDSL